MAADLDKLACPIGWDCVTEEELAFVDFVVQKAREEPNSGFLVGFATYSLMKYGRHLEALEIAKSCRNSEWFCSLVQGHVFHGVGRLEEAERLFRSGVDTAPDSIGCLLNEASWALDWRNRRGLQSKPCPERLPVSDTIWWLADPLYSVSGNDRWTEHVNRTLITHFFYMPIQFPWNARTLTTASHVRDPQRTTFLEIMIPRGRADSYRWLTERRTRDRFHWDFWTSVKGARYHFVPDFDDGDFSQPVWRLEASLEDEGYTPTYGAFLKVPVQVSRFRGAEGMKLAVAGTIRHSPLRDAETQAAHLVLSDAPGNFPLHLSAAVTDQRAVFLPDAPCTRYVLSYEVLSELGFGRNRMIVDPIQPSGPAVSDLLLFHPVGLQEPDSLLIAAGMMLGEPAVETGEDLGVFWEVYGASEGEPVQLEFQLEREGGGILDQITRLVPGGHESQSGRLSWSEPSSGPTFPNAIVLDLETLEAGSYVLTLRANWGEADAAKREVTFQVR